MRQIVIIPQQDHNIARELTDCIACLEKSRIHVYASHCAREFAVLWAETAAVSKGVRALRDAGFAAAPLIRRRPLKMGQQPLQSTTAPATNIVSHLDNETL